MNKKKDTEKKNQKMKGKLIKQNGIIDGVDYYLIIDGKIYHTNPLTSGLVNGGKLSVKNCESIVNDFDLYGEAVDYAARQGHPSPEGFSDEQVGLLHGYIDGFQKALSILGDKKFSEEQMINAFKFGWKRRTDEKSYYQSYEDFFVPLGIPSKELQKTEWDVEVEMKKVIDETKIVGTIKGVKGSGNKITTYKSVPKLDENNCLILKRIK